MEEDNYRKQILDVDTGKDVRTRVIDTSDESTNQCWDVETGIAKEETHKKRTNCLGKCSGIDTNDKSRTQSYRPVLTVICESVEQTINFNSEHTHSHFDDSDTSKN